MDKPKAFLRPPKVRPVRYPKNFIKTAVCELRFPTLLELETKPPGRFQSKIRKEYPLYDTQFVDQMDNDQVAREHRYLFRSIDKRWTVALKSFAIALETSKYVDFEDFFERLNKVIDSARDMIDADFFTRVGLRYINSVPMDSWDPTGWVRQELLSAFCTLPLGVPQAYACMVTGDMENGKYTIRHGIKRNEDPKSTEGPVYTLDFDYYCEDIEAAQVGRRVTEFNQTNFDLFHWCLGEKAIVALGPGKPK